jgi:hypothetical protein
MIWTAFNDASAYNTEGLGPHDWKSYGPFALLGDRNYLVVMDEETKKDGKVTVIADDPDINCYSGRQKDGFQPVIATQTISLGKPNTGHVCNNIADYGAHGSCHGTNKCFRLG